MYLYISIVLHYTILQSHLTYSDYRLLRTSHMYRVHDTQALEKLQMMNK